MTKLRSNCRLNHHGEFSDRAEISAAGGLSNNFSNPTGWKLGNGKRLYDELRGFGTVNEDIGIMKYWSFSEDVRLQFRMEMLNAFNRHRFDDPATDLGNSSTFGQVLSVGGWLGPRNIQYGFRLQW